MHNKRGTKGGAQRALRRTMMSDHVFASVTSLQAQYQADDNDVAEVLQEVLAWYDPTIITIMPDQLAAAADGKGGAA